MAFGLEPWPHQGSATADAKSLQSLPRLAAGVRFGRKGLTGFSAQKSSYSGNGALADRAAYAPRPAALKLLKIVDGNAPGSGSE